MNDGGPAFPIPNDAALEKIAHETAMQMGPLISPYDEGLILCALRQVRDAAAEDTKRLDWLQANGKLSLKWIVRHSWTGRGMRLHQDPQLGEHDTVRAAIDAAMNAGKGGRE